VLAPGGALLFQLASETSESRNPIGRAIRGFYQRFLWDTLHLDTPYMRMYGIPKDEVVRLISLHGGRLVDVAPDPAAGPEWKGYRYLVIRNTTPDGVVPAVPIDEVMTGDD
jgi:hypothetical protein